MNGRTALAFLRRWLLLLLLGPVLAGVAGYVVVRDVPFVYEAVVTLLVQPGDVANPAFQDAQSAQDLVQTYAAAIPTRAVLSVAAAQVGLDSLSERELENRVHARPVSGTHLLRVSADDTDPNRAAQLANAVVQVFFDQNAAIQATRFASSRENLSRVIDQLQADIDARTSQIQDLNAQAASPERDTRIAQTQNNLATLQAAHSATVQTFEDLRVSEARSTGTLTVIDPAVAADDPIRPNRSLITLLAAVAGLVAACGVAIVAELANDGLRDRQRVATVTGLSTLGVIPRVKRASDVRATFSGPQSESYRVLSNNLLSAMLEQPLRVLLIASASANEGKSTTAANLALAVAETGLRVILVDGDLHRPAQQELFGLPDGGGLCRLLATPTSRLEANLASTEYPNLKVLAAGTPAANPAGLLASKRVEAVLSELQAACDLVVIDSPAVLEHPDGLLLSRRSDAVLYVIDAERSRGRQAVRALEVLGDAGVIVVGAVLNRVRTRSSGYLAYTDHFGAAAEDATEGSGAPHEVPQLVETSS